MNIKVWIKKVKNGYVIRQARNVRLPQFESDDMVRRHYIFKGRVQKVGFRIEVIELAKRLGLTGWVNNLENGDVEAELQGPKNKIDFLVSFMESLKRIKIDSKEVKEISVVESEKAFQSDKEY
ncbi:MAG: acylphosphatase [Lachnospiraceae bacterium]|nr:acylphosphatase [Lachnospiraceae bacterium]